MSDDVTACPECDNASGPYKRERKQPTYRCRYCGAEFDEPARRPAEKPYTTDDRDCALQQAAAMMGEPLTGDEYEQWRQTTDPDAPERSTIAKRWGWSDACDAAGVETVTRAGEREFAELVAALVRIRIELGHWPNSREYVDHRQSDEPSQRWAQRTNSCPDSWELILDEANQKVEPCIAGLQRAADTLGKSPTVPEYKEAGVSPSTATIQKWCGSWNRAKELARLETQSVGQPSE